MKSKMRKKLIAFMLCMVLVICNSVSILADAPAAATTTTEKQVKETGTAKSEGESEEEKSADDEKDTSEQSDEESAPETETTEKKEETTEATTEDKEDATTATTTKAKEETTEATETSDKDETTGAEDDSDKKDDETSETSEEETDKEKTTEDKDKSSESEKNTTEAAEGKDILTELTYENDQVKIVVTANAENIIPDGTSLKVTPVINNGDTSGQYEEVKEKLEEKANEEEYNIEGFLAYDISLIDEQGNEIEPSGEVQVSIDYIESVAPTGTDDTLKDSDITVMHLKENENGQVQKVVDMSENEQLKNVQTTEENKVQKAEFVTDSFSVYTLTWKSYFGTETIYIHYVDKDGNEIDGPDGEDDTERISNEEWISITDSELNLTFDIENYEYQYAYVNDSDSENLVSQIQRTSSGMRYRNGTSGRGSDWEKQYVRVNGNNEWGYHLYLAFSEVGTDSSDETDSITFWHQQQTDDAFNTDDYYPAANDSNWSNTEEIVYHKRNVVQFMVLLADENGNIGSTDRWGNFDPNTELPEGSFVPNYYEFDVSDDGVLEINANTFAGISVPGYSYDASYAYFGWSSNHSISDMNEVYSFRNFGTYAASGANFSRPAWTNSSYSYIGYHSEYNVRNNSGSCGSKDNGWDKYNYWYQTTGIFMIVLEPVSQNVTYRTEWHNDYNPGGSARINVVDTTNADMYLDNDVNPKVWRGKSIMTDLQAEDLTSPSIGYTFKGWYTECDAEGNGTGTKISSISKDGKSYVTVDGNEVIMNQNNQFYARWEADYKTEEVNFYLNLSSTILNTTGNMRPQEKNLFTTCVSGAQSAISSDHGIGGEGINTDLVVKLPVDHEHPQKDSDGKDTEMSVILGDSTSNARDVDAMIEALKNGTVGNQPGHTDKTYQIINSKGEGAFPTDEEIFTYIKKNWGDNKNTDPATCVNKGQDIEVNGIPIDKDNLTTKNFSIRWYVFKDNSGDKWHIDGVLVPKSGILNITKTFPNAEIASDLQSTFKINVTGNFLASNGSDSTVTQGLDKAERNNNSDGTVTYTWTLAIFGEEYTVSESGYQITSDAWTYSGTDCSYIPVEGETQDKSETLENSNGFLSTTINTICNWQDEDIQESQTLAFINYYSSNNEDDSPYILVNKTFKGLSMAQIKDLYDKFVLIVQKSDSSNIKKLHLDDDNVTVSPSASDLDVIQDYTFTWKVENCTTGTYIVTEKEETVGQYDVITDGTNETVEVSEATWEFDPNVTTITDNKETDFTVGNHRIIMASLTGNDKGYVIWTNEQLTVAQQAAVISKINSKEYPNFDVGEATIENSHFYYGNALEHGINIGKGTITYKPSSDGNSGTISFSGKNVWQHVLAGSYTMTNSQNADIAVTNTYSAHLDLRKVSTDTNNSEISGARFKLTRLDGSNWVSVASKFDNFKVFNGNVVELNSLIPGAIYRLEEIEAPEAHVLLGEYIYFKVENGKVVLCNQDGSVPVEIHEMWNLDSNGTVLTVKNNILYDLPSAGGPGIYWYTLSGTLLMAGAVLIVYREKRKREVLLRK